MQGDLFNQGMVREGGEVEFIQIIVIHLDMNLSDAGDWFFSLLLAISTINTRNEHERKIVVWYANLLYYYWSMVSRYMYW